MLKNKIILRDMSLFALALSSCGKDESKERPAEVLPVAGLEQPSLSLVAEGKKCAALGELVQKFSAQYAPDVYQDVSCAQSIDTGNGSADRLNFSIRDPGNNVVSIGEMVIYRNGQEAQYVLCQRRSAAYNQVGGTFCSGLTPSSQTEGLPKDLKKEGIRTQDLIATISDYLKK